VSELERYDPAPPRTTLVARATELVAAHQIGTALAATTFAPAAFRGKPEEAAAAIVFGDEIGLTPMQALRSIYVISGTPALYSRVMVGLVLAHGHEIWTIADAPGRVVVAGRRRGSSHVEEVEWTTARAQTAGYTSNKKYQQDSQSMLYARAAGDVARRIAPDVLLGLPYTVEEVELTEVGTTTVSRSTNTTNGSPTAVRRKTARPVEAAEPEPEPPLEEEPAPIPPGTDNPEPAEPGVTKAQLSKMAVAFRERNIIDRGLRLAYCHDLLGREITSANDLTMAEASKVIDSFDEPAFDEEAVEIEDVPTGSLL